jgi:hypothetical protein
MFEHTQAVTACDNSPSGSILLIGFPLAYAYVLIPPESPIGSLSVYVAPDAISP